MRVAPVKQKREMQTAPEGFLRIRLEIGWGRPLEYSSAPEGAFLSDVAVVGVNHAAYSDYFS